MKCFYYLATAFAAASSLGLGGASMFTEHRQELADAPPGLLLTGFFQNIGLAYADLASAIGELTAATKDAGCVKPPDIKTVFEMYSNLTKFEKDQANAPQPQEPLEILDQYAVLTASYNVVVVDKAFVEALIAAKGLFKPVAGPIVGLLKTQIGLINAFIKDVKVFAPTVADVVIAADKSLLRTFHRAIDAYSCLPFAEEEVWQTQAKLGL